MRIARSSDQFSSNYPNLSGSGAQTLIFQVGVAALATDKMIAEFE